jgi:uncharacterized protein (TIGR03083 family)
MVDRPQQGAGLVLDVDHDGVQLGGLDQLDPARWSGATLCAGWDVRDLVCHLWQQAEVALTTIAGRPTWLPSTADGLAELDERIDRSVREPAAVPGPEVWRRWRERRTEVIAALRSAPDDTRIRWTVATMAPATLATTLLMEAWAQGYDVRAPRGQEL